MAAAVLVAQMAGWARGGEWPAGVARRIPSADRAILAKVADEYGLRGEARWLLYAIRIVEAGGPGREMGVLVPQAQRFKGGHARSLELQARWAAGTIRRRYTGDLEAFAERWAPRGAGNDPSDLNRHWVGNVRAVLAGWSNNLSR
jgi:hypothetical protein